MSRGTIRLLLLVASVVCFAAVVPVWPYGFFMLLRLLVFVATVLTLVTAPGEPKLRAHRVPLVVVALLFNPLIPVHFSREVWFPIDLAVGVYLLVVRRRVGVTSSTDDTLM
jgi:hypothetical protein